MRLKQRADERLLGTLLRDAGTGVGVSRDLPLVGWCVAHAVSLSCGEVVTSE